jgi:hypothetical protein
MYHRRVVKIIFVSKAERHRKMGRPRQRRLEAAENDLRNMKVTRWRYKAVDRDEWASVIKEAKAVRGPYSQGVSK